MNDRIKEIGEKAGLFMEKQHPGGFPNEELSVAYNFAELIVQECIDNIKVWELDSRNHISYMLERHFGVEE